MGIKSSFQISLLGGFAQSQKAPITSVISTCLSVCLFVRLFDRPYVRMYQRGYHWTDFREILYWMFL
jgi:hypothetical protein